MARHRLLLFLATAACALGLAAPLEAGAEDLPPAHVAYVEGSVTVEHEAMAEPAEPNIPLSPGDRIVSSAGRTEIVFGDGSLIHLDEYTTVDLLSDRLVRLLAGRLMVVAGSGLAGHLQIDAASGSVRVLSAGEYRISLLPHGGSADLELAVIRGSAELFTDTDGVALRAGQRGLATVAGALAGPWPFNSASFDAFDRWSQTRLDARRGATSYRYVPSELHHYAGVLDHYGTWSYQPTHGYVWFPRVSYGWRPYYHGRWKHYPRWGWTWIGGPRWAWPTHHFGRWGITAGGTWFWIPGRVWSGAWVHWGIAPGFVKWCPLGFDNRPVFALWSHRRHHGFNPWLGWTVVHRSHFGGRRAVHVVALDGRRIVEKHGATFVPQTAGPVVTGQAVRRAGTAPHDIAVPRGRAVPPSLAVPRDGSSASRVAPTPAPQRSGRTTPNARGAIRSQAQPAQPGTGRPLGQAVRRGEGADAPSSPESAREAPPAVPDLTPFRTRSGRSAESGTTTRPWSADDVPVYRGGTRSYGRTPPSGTTPSAGSSQPAAPPPVRAVPRSSGDSGSGAPAAVPRARSGGERGSSGAPAATAPARGRSGVPSTPGVAAPSSPPPSSAGQSGGSRARTAPSGSSGREGRAVSRGSGGGESSSGSRGGGRRR